MKHNNNKNKKTLATQSPRIPMRIIVQHRDFHSVLFFLLVSSCSMFHDTIAQSSEQQVAPPALNKNADAANATFPMMLVVFVFAFFITGFLSVYIRYCSPEFMFPQNSVRTNGVDPEVLATFPIMAYSTVKNIKTGHNVALQCAVCLGEFGDFDSLRLLPKCSHVFHPDCIDAWLASHVTCPVCRSKLKLERGQVALEIAGETSAHQVFDESPVRGVEVVGGVNGVGVSGHVDGCVGKGNGSSKMRAFGVLVRSHSTGHSLVEPGRNMERFTLRLPEEVRKQILDDYDKHGTATMMKRSASYDVVLQIEDGSCSGKGGEGSSSNNGKNNRWVLSVTPPFVSRGGGSSALTPNASTTSSGIPRFWAFSLRGEDKESQGKTIFQV
ncbi:E3 ubiquitin-protein ligase ATL6-like [Gastrolobium bilobum]|uniref:E3 ubiquitin-protein ligase ATL6-like n=1 Tax=Gastrolobium bilobum TaxID=150636 RepID=UPI002AB17D89|nr:E3 ubiquitin-protein ligase ATL6-like [Gastrolobium bilobum]